MDDILWTFEYDGELMDLEFTDRAKLEAWLDEWWAEKHADEDMRNGETREDEGFIVQFCFDDDGERKEISRERYCLCYEYYHGDFKEHNTYY